jgi:hypothetical protein
MTIKNIRTKNGRLLFNAISFNANDHCIIDLWRVSALIVKPECLILAIQGGPKQIIYCSQEEQDQIAGIIKDSFDDNIIAIKGYDNYELYLRVSCISLLTVKDKPDSQGIFVCVDGYDQHSKTGSFTQFVSMTREDALVIHKLYEESL